MLPLQQIELCSRSLNGKCLVCGEPLSLSPEKGDKWDVIHHNTFDVVGVHKRHDKTLKEIK